MNYITKGAVYNKNKTAKIMCIQNDSFDSVDIKGKRFLLIVLTEGQLVFLREGKRIVATAPCFVCFNEKADPSLVSKKGARYMSVYFHPDYLNINMTFEFIRSKSYEDIAGIHDLFLLKPVLDNTFVVPIGCELKDKAELACFSMSYELTAQRDWYWSCRGRSYFMEIIIMLERMYGIMGYGEEDRHTETYISLKNPQLRSAMLYIEGYYTDDIDLADISAAAGANHTTLTAHMKDEIGMTVLQYLYYYRVQVAKKQLAFTNVPIKEVAWHTGFKTVQHFNRTFTKLVGETPAQFRRSSVQKRKNEIK